MATPIRYIKSVTFQEDLKNIRQLLSKNREEFYARLVEVGYKDSMITLQRRELKISKASKERDLVDYIRLAYVDELKELGFNLMYLYNRESKE